MRTKDNTALVAALCAAAFLAATGTRAPDQMPVPRPRTIAVLGIYGPFSHECGDCSRAFAAAAVMAMALL